MQFGSWKTRGKVVMVNDDDFACMTESIEEEFTAFLTRQTTVEAWQINQVQKYSSLRCLLRVKGLVICFYLGWSGSNLQFRQDIIKVGSK